MKIKYTTLAGKEFEVSDEFQVRGMHVLWAAYEAAAHNYGGDGQRAKMLNEAHGIMSAVLYGTITKEEA